MHRTILRLDRPRWPLSQLFSGSFFQIRGKDNGSLLSESFHTDACSSQDIVFGCKHPTTNSLGLRVVNALQLGCKHPTTNSLGLRVVNALQLGRRRQASDMLCEIDVDGHLLNLDDVVCILDYCAKSPDALFVMETWRVLEGKNIALSWKCYLLIARALCSGGYLEEALHLVKFIGENNRISFMLPLYNCFLSACGKMKDAVLFNQCLDLMELHCLGKNEFTYAALLEVAVWQGNLSAVHEIWREHCKYYNMNIISLKKFIRSFTCLKDIKSACIALQRMVELACQEDVFLCRTVAGKIYSPQHDIPIPSVSTMSAMHLDLQQEQHASLASSNYEVNLDSFTELKLLDKKLLDNKKKAFIKDFLRWSFNDIIHACGHSQDAKLAEQLILQMRNLGLEPSSNTYDGLAKAFIRSGRIGDSMELLNIMRGENLKPCDSTISNLSVCCSNAFDLDLAEALLDQITESPFARHYNAFLQACDKMDLPERAVKMLAKMRKLKIKPDITTYELLFSLFANVNAPYEKGNLLSHADVTKRINVIETNMLQNGICHSPGSMKNLLKALGSEGMVQELLWRLHQAESQFYLNNILNTDIYNTVLHSLVEAKENPQTIEIFRNMKRFGVSPDAATYTIMMDCCYNIRCFKSACALLSIMIRGGFSPQTVTYTALIKILLECGALADAFDLLDQAISEGRKLDLLLFNTFLRKASFLGRIDVIETVIQAMHQEKIQPDLSTCSYVFTAYVEHEYFGTAIEALQVLSMRMISLDHDTLEDVRRQHEYLILEEEQEADIRIAQILKHSVNLAAALLNLRWCSIIGFPISWNPNQSPWAKRLSI